jgi:hypothetical protein
MKNLVQFFVSKQRGRARRNENSDDKMVVSPWRPSRIAA